jgi:hypothetical protein
MTDTTTHPIAARCYKLVWLLSLIVCLGGIGVFGYSALFQLDLPFYEAPLIVLAYGWPYILPFVILITVRWLVTGRLTLSPSLGGRDA